MRFHKLYRHREKLLYRYSDSSKHTSARFDRYCGHVDRFFVQLVRVKMYCNRLPPVLQKVCRSNKQFSEDTTWSTFMQRWQLQSPNAMSMVCERWWGGQAADSDWSVCPPPPFGIAFGRLKCSLYRVGILSSKIKYRENKVLHSCINAKSGGLYIRNVGNIL
jgi:hypothetical protein